jgi:threonine dehydratase
MTLPWGVRGRVPAARPAPTTAPGASPDPCCDTLPVSDPRPIGDPRSAIDPPPIGSAPPAAPERDVSLDAIRDAATRIRGRVHRTPVLASRTAGRVVRDVQGVELSPGPAADRQPRVFLKAEHLQLTGSFKPRGAINRVGLLDGDERRRGLITLSAGNHAQALAYAAASEDVPVTVVMPAGASLAKVAAARRYGAEVVLHGAHTGESARHMQELREARNLVYVPPFDDPAIIAGQGTIGLEILEDLPDVDVIVVGVGGGGLACGIAAAVTRLRPGARVYGVEPVGSNALTLALAAGHSVDLQPSSIADGLNAPFSGPWVMALAPRYLEAILLVEEPVIAAGVRFALERMKQLLEPAGAAALGAVLAGLVPLRDGDTVCVIGSGGNVDLTRLPDILALAADVAWP